LRGHRLIGFIDGTTPQPPKTVTDSSGAQSINPDFQHRHQQDQLILAWIFNSISPSLLSQLVRCETSAQVWSVITQLHSSQSMTKVLDLKL
jgi:gag-polypeptide of LTR copia-type